MSAIDQQLPEYILPNLTNILSAVEGDVIFQLSLDEGGEVVDIECLASATQPKNMIPLDLLLERPKDVGAGAVMYVSNTTGSLEQPEDCEIDFTERLLRAGEAVGVEVVDHYLVADGRLMSLRRETALWPSV